MSQLFRRITGRVESSKVCFMVISQTRDRISATAFGKKYTRSGGRALDFYASVVLYLAHVGEITRTVAGVKRPVGVRIKAKCTKNKVGLPFRSCEFPIIFAFGIEDIAAGLDWLEENKQLALLGVTQKEAKAIRSKALQVSLGDDYKKWKAKVNKAVRQGWLDVETSFLPKRGKYDG
jgi:hypothetical protein